MPGELTGVDGEIAETFNDIAELNQGLAHELDRLSKVVGKEGRIGERGRLPSATGCWSECVNSVNSMVGDLVQPTTEVARVIGAVAKGDLSQIMELEIEGRPLRGEFLRIGKVVNTMVGQLGSFTAEVTRVAREVGSEGKLGGQAKVKGVAGTWKDLTDNVNMMAGNLRCSCATCRRSRPPSPTATSPRRSPSMARARSCRSRTSSTPWWTS